MATPERIYTESEVAEQFAGVYDLPKDEGDPIDDPYRALTQWYLVSADNPDKPVALPYQHRFKNHKLYGKLESFSKKDVPPIYISIPLNGTCWVVDREHERRGIWIEPNLNGQPGSNAWYWLHEPHEQKQAAIHEPIRAKLGLFSNIVDLFLESFNDHSGYYGQEHLKTTPKQLYNQLACTDEDEFRQYQKISDTKVFQEPFDYTLFLEQGGLTFLQRHLVAQDASDEWIRGLSKSKFCRELKKLKSKRPSKQWTSEQFKESARLAERRSQRHPWGEPLPHPQPTHFNWNVEAKLSQGSDARAAGKNKRKKGGNDEEYREEPATKKARRILEDSDDDDDERQSSAASRRKRMLASMSPGDDKASTKPKLDPMANDRYSNERMLKALNKLKGMLTPAPSNETGKLNDVSEKKFRVMDASSAARVLRLMKRGTELSMECKLLIIKAFLNVCLLKVKGSEEEEAIKKLFKKNPNGIGFLETWKREAKATLDRLAEKKEDQFWYQDIVAYHFLIDYIRFIKGCFVVTEKKIINKLKKYGVDWNQPDYLEDVKAFEMEHAHTSNALRTASMLTRKHLESILKEEPDAPAPAASPAPAAPPAPAASPAPAAPAPASGVSGKQGNDAEEEKRKKRADERRRAISEQNAKIIEAKKNRASQTGASQQAAKPTSQSGTRTFQSTTRNPAAVDKSSAALNPHARNGIRLEKPSSIAASTVKWQPIEGNMPLFMSQSRTRTSQSTTRNPAAVDKSSAALNPPARNGIRLEKPSSIAASTVKWQPVEGNMPRFMLAEKKKRESGRPAALERQGGVREETSRPSHAEQPSAAVRRPSGDDRSAQNDYRERDRDRRPPRDGGPTDRDYSYRSVDNDRHERPRREDSHRRPSLDDRDCRTQSDRGGFRATDSRSNSRLNERQDEYGYNYEKEARRDTGRSFVLSRDYEATVERSDNRASNRPREDRSASNRRDSRGDDRRPAFGSTNGAAESGRGRGRGGHMTKPTWMTQNARVPEQPPVAAEVSRAASAHQPTTVRESQGGETSAGRGRGRGRDVNLPAWITRGVVNDGPSPVSSSVGHSANPHQPTGVREVQRGGASAGRGRGRGVHMTKPAWMTS